MKLRLVSYNIQRGIRLPELLALFQAAPAFRSADVIAIQEASFLASGENVLAPLSAALSAEHAWVYRPVMSYPEKEYGNGFIFRPGVTPQDSQAVPLPQVSRLSWLEKRKTEGGMPDTKSAFVQSFELGARLVSIANVHLDFAGGPQHRALQLNHLLGEMKKQAPAALDVICGDFNTVGHHRWPATAGNINAALGTALSAGYNDLTGDVAFTSDLLGNIDPADPAAGILGLGQKMGLRFRQKTDHILGRGMAGFSDAGVAAESEAALLRISDHLPLQVILEL